MQQQLTDSRQLGNLIEQGKATVGLEIDADFAQKLRSGQTAPLQVIVDATNSNTALIASGYISQIALGFAKEYQSCLLYTSQHLDDRRANQDEARPLIAEDLDKFLDQHLLQPRKHQFSLYSSLLWKLRVASSASTNVKTASGTRSA